MKIKKVYLRFNNTVLAANLAESGSLFSFNRGVKYLLCATDVFTKYAWIKHLMDKKTKNFFGDFIEIVNESKSKLNK